MDREDDLNISHEDLRTILTRPIAFHRLFADIAGSVGGCFCRSFTIGASEPRTRQDGSIKRLQNGTRKPCLAGASWIRSGRR